MEGEIDMPAERFAPHWNNGVAYCAVGPWSLASVMEGIPVR